MSTPLYIVPSSNSPQWCHWSGQLFPAGTWPIHPSFKDEKLRFQEVKSKSHIAQVKRAVQSPERGRLESKVLLSQCASLSPHGHLLQSHWWALSRTFFLLGFHKSCSLFKFWIKNTSLGNYWGNPKHGGILFSLEWTEIRKTEFLNCCLNRNWNFSPRSYCKR